MPNRRIKVELQGVEGEKYTIALEGRLNDANVSKILNMVQLLNSDQTNISSELPKTDTAFAKIQTLVQDKFPFGEFTSADILEAYEDNYNTPINTSTISTYLSRLAEKDFLSRRKLGVSWLYRRAKALAT